jgi:energy-coupling factor transport system ATP-binding protein
MLKRLQQENAATIIMVSHSIKDIITMATRIAVLDNGKLIALGSPQEILAHKDFRELPDILLPDYLQLMYALAGHGKKVSTGVVTMEEAELEIIKLLEGELK